MEPKLMQRARRTYERARLRSALPWLLPAAMLGAGAWWVNGRPEVGLLTALLGVALVGFAWRGGQLARGVPLGLVAGVWTAAYPLAAACSLSCASSCAVGCTTATAIGGAAAGLFLLRSKGSTDAISALTVASLIGAMGCLTIGFGGLIGVGLVLAVGMASASVAPALRPA